LELEPKEEEIPILSQPPPKDDGDPSLIPKEEPQDDERMILLKHQGNEAIQFEKVED
jgi:hypothetical protein